MIARFRLGAASQVIEIASDDGYLLQYFQARGIPVLGIAPATNVAEAARAKGIATDIAFFGHATACALRAAGRAPDLIVANKVLAHVPDLNDFVAGLAHLLPPRGAITIEIPHLLALIEHTQFDTIYHEHFSYFSLLSAERVLAHHGLTVFDVEELPTHGGSLRLFAGHRDAHEIQPSVASLRAREREAGLDGPAAYAGFAAKVAATRDGVRAFFKHTRRDGALVLGYGAPAKGNTLLNHCDIWPEQMPFTVDRSPHKQGLLLPGTRIPVRHPDAIAEARPDFLFILPWNLTGEIMRQMAFIRGWSGRFVVLIPALRILA
ncbi:MAG TPA: class I SAM-dependent methyltransferase [Acetobacteraceae bacterium]